MSKRILIVQFSSQRDGSAISGLLLADGLRAAGIDVHAVFGHEGRMIGEYQLRGHEVYVSRHRSWLRHDDSLRFSHDLYMEWIHSFGLHRLLRRVNPDLVYLNTSVSLAGALAARRLEFPVIWHLRELFSDVGGEMQAPTWTHKLVQRTFTHFASNLVVPSKAIAENMLGRYADRAKVVPNAAGTKFFEAAMSQTEARIRMDLPVRATIIGLPGMLRPMKGHSFFFETIAPWLRKREDHFVAVTGSGKDRYVAQLRSEVAALGISEKIEFLGVVEDMPAFYRSCDLTVIPSRAEPFGRTVIESMASKAPVIASRVGGIPEIIQHGETGLLFEYGDSAELVEHVGRLLDDPEKADALAETAFRVAEEHYHERVYKRRIVEIVRQVLDG